MPPDTTPNVSATEKRIAEAALRLFADRGTLDVSVSELAAEAGVARGTLYRNVQSIDELFEQVVKSAAVELHARIALVLDSSDVDDPAARLATALRLLVRLAHEDPDLGRFIVRFGLSQEMLFAVLTGPPIQDVKAGIATGRYAVTEAMTLSVASLMSGATISAMWMVIEGHQAWREAGSRTAELLLRALGIDPDEAGRLAALPLPALPVN
jgi:AcrR family transcriptional regulator